MHSPFWPSVVCQSCVAAIGVMRFSCVASAAHFLYNRKLCNFLLCKKHKLNCPCDIFCLWQKRTWTKKTASFLLAEGEHQSAFFN